MIVNENLFPETIIPQSDHNRDQVFLYDLIFQVNCTGHADVMMGMTPKVKRRPGQIAGGAGLGGFSSNPFQDLGNHEGIQRGNGVRAMLFGATDGDKDDVIFFAIFNHFMSNGGLEIGAGFR